MRAAVLATLLSLMLVLLAACSGTAAPPDSPSTGAEGGTGTGTGTDSGSGSAAAPSDNEVIIYASAEEYRIEYWQQRLDEALPEYEITIEYLPTGNLAARLQAEGAQTPCDIIGELDYGYLGGMTDQLADLSALDTSAYLPDLLPDSHTYLPMYRNGGCIAVNTSVLQAKGLPVPHSYEDLLDPQYKGLISMPNPKTSGTGYMFLKSLVNAWGEEEAFAYFDQLAPNILQFTESGSGPVNALIQGEVAIGLAMTGQAVVEINEGAPLDILYFEEGSPFSLYGVAVIKGRLEDPAVAAVLDFFNNTLIYEDKERFFPEKIYTDVDIEMENFPVGIVYADMSDNTPEERERLLGIWQY
ncbi:MAG: extracellular solute-binding protein [Coriobacteriales bacterium]|nr:extracellular solute-binding protein [Coriobacteriales bacterium]